MEKSIKKTRNKRKIELILLPKAKNRVFKCVHLGILAVINLIELPKDQRITEETTKAKPIHTDHQSSFLIKSDQPFSRNKNFLDIR